MFRHSILNVNGNAASEDHDVVELEIHVEDIGNAAHIVLVNKTQGEDAIVLHKNMPLYELRELGNRLIEISNSYGHLN